MKKALLHFILDLYSDVYDLSLILEQNPNATLKQITISQCHKSSCSDSHLVQNLILFKIPPCSKSHLVQNPTLFKISPCSKSHLAEPLLVTTPLAEPLLVTTPLAEPLLVPTPFAVNLIADPPPGSKSQLAQTPIWLKLLSCCRSSCSPSAC